MNKIEPMFLGKVEKGKVRLAEKQAYMICVAGLEGKDIELMVRKRRKKRSKSQNSYLWGKVYSIIAEHSGYDNPEEVHEAMKRMFLTVHRDNLPDTVCSTTDLSTAEFSEYVDSIKRWASNFLGVYIPDAGEIWE